MTNVRIVPKHLPFELLVATRNPGKIEELVDLLSGLPAIFRGLSEFESITEADEVGTTYEENATLKAANYASQTGIAALADDSGLEVDALHGQPGVLSARFGGNEISDEARTELLLKALAGVESSRRSARFVCSMVLFGKTMTELGKEVEPRILAVSRGVCEGSIATFSTGTNGFGFDPVFVPRGYGLSFAALDPAVKASISHRAKAAKQMRHMLEQMFAQT